MSKIKELTRFYSLPENFRFVNSAPNEGERQRRIEELKRQFEQSNFSGEQIDPTTDLQQGFPEMDAVERVRRDFENAVAVEVATAHAAKKNEILRRNRERAKQNVSRPYGDWK